MRTTTASASPVVTANITDNDAAGVTITESGTTDVGEGGATDSYDVVLNSQPATGTTVTITIGTADGQTTTTPTSLVFDDSNWNVAQSVTVTAVDDAVAEGLHAGSITHTATSTDANYRRHRHRQRDRQHHRQRHRGCHDHRERHDRRERRRSDRQLRRGAQQSTAGRHDRDDRDRDQRRPDHDRADQPGVRRQQLERCPERHRDRGRRRSSRRPLHTGSILHTATSTDANYNGIGIASVTANITDNDAAGVTITESGTTDVSEGGATDSYDVVLNSQPEAGSTVTIAIATSDGQTTTTPTSLVFDDTNWNVAQSVTVTAVDDAVAEGSPHAGSISHTATSTDANYNGIAIASLTANITDNDTAGCHDHRKRYDRRGRRRSDRQLRRGAQ